jgi:hypothetical protein
MLQIAEPECSDERRGPPRGFFCRESFSGSYLRCRPGFDQLLHARVHLASRLEFGKTAGPLHLRLVPLTGQFRDYSLTKHLTTISKRAVGGGNLLQLSALQVGAFPRAGNLAGETQKRALVLRERNNEGPLRRRFFAAMYLPVRQRSDCSPAGVPR